MEQQNVDVVHRHLAHPGYNMVIDEHVAANGTAVPPPDFYAYFQEHPDEIFDGVHPNRTGYEAMANQWFTALTHMVR